MKRLPLLLPTFLCAWFAAAGCDRGAARPARPGSTLHVFAAASLAEPFDRIGKAFEQSHPGARVVFNFAGSQQLRAQLDHGARADLFASANLAEMESAVAAGLVRSDSVRVFARNKLVVIFPKRNPARLATLLDLARPGVKIDAADPAVPVGKYTRLMLARMSDDKHFGAAYQAAVLANMVSYEENVKSVLSKVRLGEADAGVVYVSDARGAAAVDVGTLPVPDEFNPPAEYPAAVLGSSRDAALAGQFLQSVLSAQGQGILRECGFITVETKP